MHFQDKIMMTMGGTQVQPPTATSPNHLGRLKGGKGGIRGGGSRAGVLRTPLWKKKTPGQSGPGLGGWTGEARGQKKSVCFVLRSP